MNIDVLLVSEDSDYIKRLTDMVRRVKPQSGDTLNTAVFTDMGKLRSSLGTGGRKGRAKYQIALIDEDADIGGVDFSGIFTVALTGASTADKTKQGFNGAEDVLHIYKYQRISGLTEEVLFWYKRSNPNTQGGKGGHLVPVYAFFSAQGGSGSSSVSAAYAVALARAGIKPMYVSLEFFNSTELFFSDPTGGDRGLYDIFSMIAAKENVSATIDMIKNTDARGVAFLKKFGFWTEISEIKPEEIIEFIEAAQSSHDTGALVIDLGNAYTQFTEAVFDQSDEIFVVADARGFWHKKLQVLLNEDAAFVRNHGNRINLVFNKSGGQERYAGFSAQKVAHVSNIMINQPAELINSIAGELAGSVNNPV